MGQKLVAVHAHPDDESLTMGGTLARYARAGAAVTVVTATLGEQGEVMDPALTGLDADHADQLGGYRYAELLAACAALGVRSRMLGGVGRFRDSGMAGTPSAGHPRAFVRARRGGPDHGAAVRMLAELLAELAPDVVLTYAADGGYGHPDHLAAHEVTVAAAPAGVRVCAVVRPAAALREACAALPVPAGYRAPEPADVGFVTDAVDIGVELDEDARRARDAALAAHATQLDVLPGGFALTNRVAQPLLAAEYYQVLAGPPAAPGAADLFAGLA